MVKRVLMIAFHYPPMRGSSGIQRALKFSQYLPQSDWMPLVLSAHPRAYASKGPDQLGDIPNQAVVVRSFALDTSRHLSIFGRYPGWLALPDRWSSWLLGAVPDGLRLIRRYRPQVIWSTYPIATAHLIGLALRRLTGLPWIADLRDPMTDVDYPADPFTRKVFRWIEAQTVRHCSIAVCTTPGAIVTYRTRFPQIPAERFVLIENAYDEENFAQAETGAANDATNNAAVAPAGDGQRCFTLVHSGVIYPSERDPRPFFEALSALLQSGEIAPGRFQVVLRATAHDDWLRPLIEANGIAALVTLAPRVSYRVALAEMLAADGLLILQAGNCNHQIPAKLYEYLRARRPLLALTDPAGDTASALRKAGIDTIAALDSKEDIMLALRRFMALAAAGAAPLATPETIAAHSRQARSRELADLLDRVATVAAPLDQPLPIRDGSLP
jgi:hypothetical protein